MRRDITTLIAISVIFCFALAPNTLCAQESKRVEVTTYYLPEVSEASKIDVPVRINDEPVIHPDIEYSVNPETWQIELNPYTFKPATATYWDYNRASHFYAKLGAGYPLLTVGKLHYMTQNERVGYFGVGVDHDGDFALRVTPTGVERTMAQSYAMKNRVAMQGGVFAGKRMFEATVNYDYDIYNTYADMADDPFRQQFHDIGAGVRFGDDFADLSRLNFDVEIHGGYWSHPTYDAINNASTAAIQELRIGGTARAARIFGKNRVGATIGYDLWSDGDRGAYSDNRAMIGVDYARKFGIVDIDAGVMYMYDKVEAREKASHFVMPHAKVLVDLQKAAFAPYAEFRTTVSQNGVRELYKQNPFIDYALLRPTLEMMPNTRSYDVAIGFSGSAWSKRLAYRAYAGFNFIRNQLFWYMTQMGWFGVHAADNTRSFVGVEVECQPVGGLNIALDFYAHANNNDCPYLDSESKMTADIKVEYIHKRWKVYAKADLFGRREWSGEINGEGVAPLAFEMPTTVDLGVGASFRATRFVELYVDGLNLLNKRIYDFAHYYRPGAGFNAGVKLHF